MTTGENSFCFRLSPCDCTASKEEPGGGSGNAQYLNPLIVSGNKGQVLGPAGIVSRNASRNMRRCVQGEVQLVFSWNKATWTT